MVASLDRPIWKVLRVGQRRSTIDRRRFRLPEHRSEGVVGCIPQLMRNTRNQAGLKQPRRDGEPAVGFEPTACCLRNSCSAPELRWRAYALPGRHLGDVPVWRPSVVYRIAAAAVKRGHFPCTLACKPTDTIVHHTIIRQWLSSRVYDGSEKQAMTDDDKRYHRPHATHASSGGEAAESSAVRHTRG